MTCNTLKRLVGKQPNDRFIIGMGADVLADLPTWEGFEELTQYASIIAFPNRTDGGTSSTLVRHRFLIGLSINNLVPPEVEDYMNDHREIFIERWFGKE